MNEMESKEEDLELLTAKIKNSFGFVNKKLIKNIDTVFQKYKSICYLYLPIFPYCFSEVNLNRLSMNYLYCILANHPNLKRKSHKYIFEFKNDAYSFLTQVLSKNGWAFKDIFGLQPLRIRLTRKSYLKITDFIDSSDALITTTDGWKVLITNDEIDSNLYLKLLKILKKKDLYCLIYSNSPSDRDPIYSTRGEIKLDFWTYSVDSLFKVCVSKKISGGHDGEIKLTKVKVIDL